MTGGDGFSSTAMKNVIAVSTGALLLAQYYVKLGPAMPAVCRLGLATR